jgi:glycosyltransferase involved in cell wall biosynthesis
MTASLAPAQPTTAHARPADAALREAPPVRVLFMQSQEYFGADSGIQALLLRSFDRQVVRPSVALTETTFEDPDLDAGRRFRAIPDVRVRPTYFGPTLFERSRLDKLRHLPELAPMPLSLLGLARYVRRNKIQVIHGTEKPRDALYGVLVGKLTGARSIVHLHVKHADWIQGAARWALNHADAILGVSAFVARSAIAAGHAPSRVFHDVNGIDLSGAKWDPSIDGSAARQSLGVAPGAPLIGITARLFSYKGHHHLIDALALVKARIPEVRLAIIGEEDTRIVADGGSYLAKLKAQARRLDLEEQVVFAGYRKDIPQLLAAFDVMALPTWEEPCAVAFLEAMAMARPVVAWHSGGTPEMVVHGETGLLVEPNATPALADALTAVLLDRDLGRRFGQAGRRRIEERHTPRRMCKDATEVYRTVLGLAPSTVNTQSHLWS